MSSNEFTVRYAKTERQDDGRKYVLMYENDELKKKVEVSDMSHYFIRDVIENWNDGLINV